MARQEVNIGIEGNDGTGDSIRQSFKKVNENFTELYAVFGIGGQINFTNLSDTPDALLPSTLPFVNLSGTAIELLELASNNSVNPLEADTVTFSYSTAGKLIVSTAFKQLADDLSPTLGGPINAAGWGIANVGISDAAALAVNTAHDGLNSVTIDDLVITKGYADGRYVSADIPLRTDLEATGSLHYSLEINRYTESSVEIIQHYDAEQNLIQGGHGLDSNSNGTAFVFIVEDNEPTNLFNGVTYYIRVIDNTRLYLFTFANKEYATGTDIEAETYKIDVAGTIGVDDTHILRDASYDPTLAGNFLSDMTLPRFAVTRRQGDTMTGALYLHDHPGELAGQGAPNGPSDLQAATKYYVDNTSYSSPEVLFVSTQGDDSMDGVPPGKEGTSYTYAYASINKAAARAEELIKAAPATPGPYMQTLTYSTGNLVNEGLVLRADVNSSVYAQTRFLLEQNREFLQKEVIAYVNYTFPNFSYNIDTCERDVGLIIDALAFDINRGLNANYLTRQAAERYYASTSGRRAITVQLTETLAAIEETKKITNAILQNEFYQKLVISDITNARPARVTTSTQHGWSDKNIVIIENAAGMPQINGTKAYIKVFNLTSFELYADQDLLIPIDTTGFTGYTQGGIIGLRYQTEVDQFFDDGLVEIENITQTNPVRVTTKTFHFLSDNNIVEFNNISTIAALNGQSYYVKRINDTIFDLYTSATAVGTQIVNVTNTNPVEITTSVNHSYTDGDYVTITLVSGTVELNQAQFYVKPDAVDGQKLTLYQDLSLTQPVDGTAFGPYLSGGEITSNSFDGTGFPAYVDPVTLESGGGEITKDSNADSSAILAISDKFNLVKTILENGIDAGANIVYGSTYRIAVTNGNLTYLDQTNPSNTDALPGKILRGKRSNAIGQIVTFTNNSTIDAGTDPFNGNQENNPTTFQVNLLAAKDFELGEPLEFGNFVKKKEVVIRIEAGNYYEDFPIRLSNNVSLKGDEFRRVIIQPRTETNSNIARVSQSKWATQYFYRDNTFDGLTLARGGTPFFNQEGIEQGKFGYHYLTDPATVISTGAIINNPGNFTNAATIISKNKDYLIEETAQYLSDRFPALVFNKPKSRRDTGIIIDSIVYDLINGGEERTLETQGSFQRLSYITQSPPITTYDVNTASYDYTTGILILDIGIHTLTVNDYIKLANESLTFTCQYNPTIPLAYPAPESTAYEQQLDILEITSSTITVNVGTPPNGSAANSPHTFVSATSGAVIVSSNTTQLDSVSQEIACSAAIDNIASLCSDLLNLTAPDVLIVDQTFNVTAATFVPTTGILQVTIGNHNLQEGEYIEIEPESITFTCASDGNVTPYAYPRTTDPAYKTKLIIESVTSTTITVNVGVSPETSTHTFVSATPAAVTFGKYSAGSQAVTSVVQPDLDFPAAELASNGIVGALIDKINFAFNRTFNPPLRNDQVDMFLMSDTTIIRNVSCRGHGGFMVVLDPEGQVLTKSPYIQTASSFSKSINQKTFAGGMFVDAYVGNLPTSITGKINNFTVQVQSNVGEGLRLRPPQLPCPFYVEGRRYQVNAISDYDSGLGTAILYLDPSSNDNTGYDQLQFADQQITREIFLQTAGNRSVLANDFTQINDLGYGLVCTNAAFSEQVSTFTYYCQTAMYASNGSEIRALNCSNGYGNFGLVAEGADPNEIPDQVTLTYNMVMPVKAFTDGTNAFDDPAIVVYDIERTPNASSLITINHPVKGTLNYRISTVVNLSDKDNDGVSGLFSSDDVVNTGVKTLDLLSLSGDVATNNGTYTNVDTVSITGVGTGLTVTVQTLALGTIGTTGQVNITLYSIGENYAVGDTIKIPGSSLGGVDGGIGSGNDLLVDIGSIHGSTPGVINNTVYRFELIADNVSAEDFYPTLQEAVSNGEYLEYADSFQVAYSGLRNVANLVTRPSTAINYDESDNATYRSISFQNTDSLSRPLPQLIDVTGAITVVVGEVITQAGNSATGVVFSQPSATQIELRFIVGAFNSLPGAGELTGSISGALGPNSVPINQLIDKTLCTIEVGYDFVDLQVSLVNTGQGYGSAPGDTRIAIQSLTSANEFSDDIRLVRNSLTQQGLLPTDPTYRGVGNNEGGMIFSWAGKTHQVINYQKVYTINLTGNTSVIAGQTITQLNNPGASAIVFKEIINSTILRVYLLAGTFNTTDILLANGVSLGANSVPASIPFDAGFAFIEIDDYAGSNIHPSSQSIGINEGISTEKFLRCGLVRGSTGEITIAISLLRATGHDFTQIGSGSFNQSNYPNVILGPAINPLGDYYTDSDTATSAQVWERRKGRVFFVSTDQDGFFRVGKFFSVDQATGDITFAGEIGLSNANSLGFKKGVTINEFSADDSFSDQSGQAVPTEKASSSYINRVLGYTVSNGLAGSQIPASGNRIGPGFLALNGATPMEGDLNIGNYRITNLGNPVDPNDSVNKTYVDTNSEAFNNLSSLRNFVELSPTTDEVLVATGNKIIFTEIESGGAAFAAGQQIEGTESGATGTIVQISTVTDLQLGTVRKIIYQPASGNISTSQDAIRNYLGGGWLLSEANTVFTNAGVPYNEYTHASASTLSDIGITVTRTGANTEIALAIKPGVILNADVNANASISQSKLSMTAASTRANATGIVQADRGLASFNNAEFAATSGWIYLVDSSSTTTGIAPSKLQYGSAGKVLGRSAAGDGPISLVDFSTVISDGGAIAHSNFGTYAGTGNDVLLRSADLTYTTKKLSTAATADTIVLRNIASTGVKAGSIRAEAIILGGTDTYEVLSLDDTTLQVKTPGQGIMMRATGTTTDDLNVEIPGILNVGQAFLDPLSTTSDVLKTSESQVQTNSGVPETAGGRQGKGFLASNWVYAKAIEDLNDGCGFVFGDKTGFLEGGVNTIVAFTNGVARLRIDNTNITLYHDIVPDLDSTRNLGSSSIKFANVYADNIVGATVSGGSLSGVGDITPDSTNTRNIGASNNVFNTIYATTFSGTATKSLYADLAENYLADEKYEDGTVLVFGGAEELTVTNSKGDKRVAGVVSTNPAHLMNDALQGEHVTPLALQGRVPCKVIGKVAKGDMLVTSAIPGYAIVDNDPRIGTVLGKAVGEKTDDGKGVVEIVVGRL